MCLPRCTLRYEQHRNVQLAAACLLPCRQLTVALQQRRKWMRWCPMYVRHCTADQISEYEVSDAHRQAHANA